MKSRLFAISAFLLLLLGSGGAVHAQTLEIRGKVQDSKGEALGGAIVLVKGTATGVLVSDDGTYVIKAKKNAVLEASLLGYATEIQEVNGRTIVNFTLKDDSVMLEEAVVEVGYGEQRVVDLTGAVERVDAGELSKISASSLDQALQGRMAGVSLSSSDGQPGVEMDILIRGTTSISQSNSPLFVIDGFPMEDYSISTIHPKDVASITILKDASSSAIYGSRGANGVILIETKKGKQGNAEVSYSGSVGVQQVSRTMEMMDAYDFVKYQLELVPSLSSKYLDATGLTLEDYKGVPAIDWQQKIFRTALVHSHNVSVIGGVKGARYSASVSHSNQDGVIRNSSYGKTTARLNLESDINRKLLFSANVSYTDSDVEGQTAANSLSTLRSYATYLMYRVWAFRPVILSSDPSDSLFDDEESSGVMNPVRSNDNEQISKTTRTLVASGKLVWKIDPRWKVVTRAGYTWYDQRYEEFNNSNTYKGYYNPAASTIKGVNGKFSTTSRTSWLSESTITYTPVLGKDHRLTAMGGFSMQEESSSLYGFSSKFISAEALGMSGLDTGLPDEISSTLSGNFLMSFLGRLNYTLKGRYVFTGSLRADGSSRFAAGHKWGLFPSGAFAWRLGRENFIQNINWISDAKLRLSYGLTGNNRIPDYAAYSAVTIADYYSIGGGTPAEAYAPSSIQNDGLTWEKTSQINAGVDLYLLANRIKFTVDAYYKVTNDLLLNAKLPYSTGFASVYKNVGKVSNRGLELSLRVTPVRTSSFAWDADINFSLNRSKVLELADGQQSLLTSVSFTGDYNSSYPYICKVGGPVAAFYGVIWDGNYQYSDFDIVDGKYVLKDGVPANGNARETIQPGDIKYVDINKDGTINTNDMVVIGRCYPLHTGGISNSFTWKNLSASFFLQWSYGNNVLNANRLVFEGNYAEKNINQYKSYTDRWSDSNQTSSNYRTGGEGPRGIYSSRVIEDGSFLRLKDARISYTFPPGILKKLRASALDVYVSGQNLWIWTAYSGLDPEVSTKNSALTPGFDYSAYARNRVYQFGLDIKF